jgi:hypothetical protein
MLQMVQSHIQPVVDPEFVASMTFMAEYVTSLIEKMVSIARCNDESCLICCKSGIPYDQTPVQRKTHCEKVLRKTMARLAKVVLVDRIFYNFFGCN